MRQNHRTKQDPRPEESMSGKGVWKLVYSRARALLPPPRRRKTTRRPMPSWATTRVVTDAHVLVDHSQQWWTNDYLTT